MEKKTRDSLLVICALVLTGMITVEFTQEQREKYAAMRVLDNLETRKINSLEKTNRKLTARNKRLEKENRRILSKYSYQLDREKKKSKIEWSKEK